MFATIPRKKGWIQSLLKHDFDVSEMTNQKIKMYYDVDLTQCVGDLHEPDHVDFDLENAVLLEGPVAQDELSDLYRMDYMLLVAEVKHTHILANEGFYGESEIGSDDYPIDGREYWVKVYLNKEASQQFLDDWVLVHLKDIRLNEITH